MIAFARQADVDAVLAEFDRGINSGDYSAFQTSAHLAEAAHAVARERGWTAAYAWKVYKKAHKKVSRDLDEIWNAAGELPVPLGMLDALGDIRTIAGASDALHLAYENLVKSRGAEAARAILAACRVLAGGDEVALIRSLHAAVA